MLLPAVLCLPPVAASPPPGSATLRRFEDARVVMGVQARIILYGPDEAAARAAAVAAFDRLASLDAVMSDYRRDSELRRLGAASGRGPVAVSDDLFRVLARSQEIAAATDGAFDVTVGPFVELWRRARRTARAPADDALAAAAARAGWRRLALDPETRTVDLAAERMSLDLGGIGKGFAADEVVRLLADRGHDRCLVDLGGDIACGRPPPGAEAWRVGLDDGGPDLALRDGAAVATSGDTEQFVEIDGVRHSHVVDPRTGRALTRRRRVTVVAPDGATADALASALSVLGPEATPTVLARFPGTAARVVEIDDEGVEHATVAGSWPAVVRGEGG
ncbi:MAG: FAD:protein FMN transferase [Planctomycetota bacterium]|jgi:thiamine biosynthesis lipoprotein